MTLNQLTDEQIAELRTTAKEWIAPGFRAREGLAEALVEFHEDFDVAPEAGLAAAQRVVDEVWRDRLQLEATWSDTGDYGRLAAAFESLAAEGLVCRMDFTCCQTCGTDEIDDERTARVPTDGGDYPYKEWAYTFFHQQDSERLADPDPVLFLSYSAFRVAPGLDPDLIARWRAGDADARKEVAERTDVAVGEKVRDALVAHGLSVDWNGASAQRIRVRVPNWRKPLPRG